MLAAHHSANQRCACAFIQRDKPYELMIQKLMHGQSKQAHIVVFGFCGIVD